MQYQFFILILKNYKKHKMQPISASILKYFYFPIHVGELEIQQKNYILKSETNYYAPGV